jgi:hypothetical protein
MPCAVSLSAQEERATVALSIENSSLRQHLSASATTTAFVDLASGLDYAAPAPFASLTRNGQELPATALAATPAVVRAGETARVELTFGDSGVTAVLRMRVFPRYYTVEVSSVSDQDVEQLTFGSVSTTLKGEVGEPFALAGMALNLKTNVVDCPRPLPATRAMCVPRFGLRGAKLAIVACPPNQMRQVMQEVVKASPELPQTALGGPFAMDQPITAGSYLFNFGDMSEATVDEWVKCAQSIGFTQIDFHGGASFRFGDFRPNPTTYPDGYASLRCVIDKLHASGLKAGLHTYAFFIDKQCPYVTPKPDPRLAKDATLTLAAPLTTTSATVPVLETTAQMSAVTGFFVRNSATLQIDDELITYTGVAPAPPYGFTGLQRGACGTVVAAHAAGAKVQHLKECFGLFVPDPETTMLAEIAANTARIYNECGFDMIYLDALDGEDILGGGQYAWHYGSQFAFEICRRLHKPALMEMSTFHHHLWYVRSRLGAWDHPNRSHKRFIDLHCQANEANARMFLPSTLGWWALKTWTASAGEPTFADDIEYLCCKAAGTGSGLALMGINPGNYDQLGAMKQLGPILKRYEDLRNAGAFSEPVKAKLRVPGDEYTLIPKGSQWQLQPIQYAKHKVEGLDGWSDRWETDNRFGEQPVQLRIEALLAPGAAYEAPESVLALDPAAPGVLTAQGSAPGVTATLTPSTEQVKVGTVSAKLTATSSLAERRGSWAKFGATFAPPLNLTGKEALGLWVYGDGQGEVLNLQVRSPRHLTGEADHYIIVDFTGWRYCELLEPEGERHASYGWPYGDIYTIYREFVNYGSVAEINVWVNNLPPGQPVTCYLSPIRALPAAETTLTNPAVTVARSRASGNRTITFPVTLTSGMYLEYRSAEDCQVYGPEGNVVSQITPQGEPPLLPAGQGQVRFSATGQAGRSVRANVWVISRGEAFATK